MKRSADDAPPGRDAAAWLDAAGAAAVLARLSAARPPLAALGLDARLAALGRVAALWLADAPRRASAAREIARATGYAAAMVDLCLERTFAAWSEPHLEALFAPLRAALGAPVPVEEGPPADAHAARPGVPRAVAEPPRLVVTVLAQNTPGLAVAPVFTALALGSAVVVKSARGEPAFAAALARSITGVDATLGEAVAALTWPGGDAAIEATLFAAADRVVAYGSAATVEAVRQRVGDRAIARGPRVSLAVVDAGAGASASGERSLGEIARALARDVAFLDQRGCLSPQLVLVDARLDRAALGQELAAALAELEREWPRRRLSLAEAAAFRRACDEAEADALAGVVDAVHGAGGAPFAVVVERSSGVRATPLDRFVRLHPYAGAEALSGAIAPLRGSLECAGLASTGAPDPAIPAALLRAGAARLCAIGDMQDPPAAWHAGGKPPVVEYLTWATRELDAPDAAPRGAAPARGGGARPEPLAARFRRHVAQTSDAPRGIEVVRASGCTIVDAQGRRWLDLLAGIGVASIGHAHPEVARAVARQVQRYTHVMVYGEDVLEPQVEVATRLASLLPPGLQNVYLTNSGAEAVEGALKLVRKATGRSRVLAFAGAFHGDTTGALALGGNPVYREPFRPLVADVEHLPWDDAAALERIDASVAGVFAEPVQAEAGVRVPSADFLPRLAARCREVGALLVLDEVVTGLGRTGRWFAFEHWPGAEPDVLLLAKALGGGLPLGAFVSSAQRMAVLAHDPPLGHVTTFGGNPVSCAAALASLDVIAREELVERAARVGRELRDALASMVGRGPLIAVRGLGLLIGLELASAEETARFVDACRARGVLLGWTLHHDRVVRLAPPLVISPDEVRRALAAIGQALDAA